MKQGRFTGEQIVRILRETDQDSVAEVAKRHGISQPTIYAWRQKKNSAHSQVSEK